MSYVTTCPHCGAKVKTIPAFINPSQQRHCSTGCGRYFTDKYAPAQYQTRFSPSRGAIMEEETIYAVCLHCAHVEPRPERASEDWMPCESCGAASPDLIRDLDRAEDVSQAVLDGF